MEKYKISFNEWLFVGFGIFASVSSKLPAVIDLDYFYKSDGKIANDEVLKAFVGLILTKITDVKSQYYKVRERIGSSIAPQFETYLQGAFINNPLLKIDEDGYLVIHKQMLLNKVIEGIYDICKVQWPGIFGNEFGKAFEKYVDRAINEYIDSTYIFTEAQMQKYTEEKVCDYIIYVIM